MRLVHTEEVTGSIPVLPTQLSGRFRPRDRSSSILVQQRSTATRIAALGCPARDFPRCFVPGTPGRPARWNIEPVMCEHQNNVSFQRVATGERCRAICVVCYGSSSRRAAARRASSPPRRPAPMITKGFTPRNGAKVFVIMKTPPGRTVRPGAGHRTTFGGPATPRIHLTSERSHNRQGASSRLARWGRRLESA